MTLHSLDAVLPRVPGSVFWAGGDEIAHFIAEHYAAESFVFHWHHGGTTRQVLYGERDCQH